MILIGDGMVCGCQGTFTTATTRGIRVKSHAVLYEIPYETVFSKNKTTSDLQTVVTVLRNGRRKKRIFSQRKTSAR